MMTARVRERAISDDQAWAAVLGRDRALDGQMVYGVLSTGIYCRPSCPSRRPRRHNATFFAAPAEAERAGFRACLRCDPRGERVPAPPAAVLRARAHLDAHFDEPLTLGVLAREAGMAAHHLQRTFKKTFGVTPKEYQDHLRTQRLKRELRTGGSVTTAIHEAGYGSASRVYESSDARLGMPPGAYRSGGKGIAIRFATVASPLGRLLVAATERGVCAVALGDADPPLEAALRAEYPAATIEPGLGALEATIEALVGSLAGAGALAGVPTDVRGTAFQHRVWNALRAIPYGETRSYAQVAAAIGNPKAARAVARACATNPIALLVPCHRVIGSSGAPGGYRWGAARKQALLAREASRKR
jgi:AraC family transcriptional regulator, regulatory protein of adaptative response / methylated-DNA-[protein]-cysteine methyltransferase